MLIALVAAVAIAAPSSTVRVGERDAAVVLIQRAKSGAPNPSDSVLLSAFDRALRQNTGLRAESVERAGLDRRTIDACDYAERLSCWTRALDARRTPALLIVLSLVPSDAGHRIGTIAVDVAVARQRLVEYPNREIAEEAIFNEALLTKPTEVQTDYPAAIDAFFIRWVQGDLRPVLDRLSQWKPFGRIEVVAATGSAVRINGDLVTTTAGGLTLLEDLPVGTHRVVVGPLDAPTFDDDVVVSAGPPSRIEVGAASAGPGRTALLVGGLAALAGGTALAIVGAAGESSTGACLVRGGQPCDGTQTLTLGTPSSGASILVPVGLGVAAAGGTWSLGSLLEAEPWIALVGGLAVGGATAAIVGAVR